MCQFSNVQKIIKNLKPVFQTEKIALKDSLNRILQEDVISDINMPPFDKSAMDGYACRIQDIGKEMEVLEVIQAGMFGANKIGPEQCSKIMTGAAVPNGADCVFMIEHAKILENGKVVCTNLNTVKNICYQGEDYKKGNVLVSKGAMIKASHIAVFAGAGYSRIRVAKIPKIALISTGSELVEPHEILPLGKIRNSNASQVLAQLKKIGFSANYLGLVKDDYQKLSEMFTNSFHEFDILIFTGGASVGDFDFIPHIIKEKNFSILWERTGLKPGNPMTVAQKGNKFCISLSGNPVSSFIQFEFIVKPLLFQLLNTNDKTFRVKAEMASDYYRNKADRLAAIPVLIDTDGKIEVIKFHGSAHINSLVFANGIMEIPNGILEIKKGESAYVRPF